MDFAYSGVVRLILIVRCPFLHSPSPIVDLKFLFRAILYSSTSHELLLQRPALVHTIVTMVQRCVYDAITLCKRCCTCPTEPPALYLASGAQDTYIRIWRISEQSMSEASSESADATTAFARSSLHRNAMKDFDRCFAVDALHSESSEESSQPSPPVSYAVRLDALLVGHDNWVYSVRWHPPVYQASCQAPYQPPVLLSASMDRTMIMWSPDVASNVWVDSVRMGEAGGNYIQVANLTTRFYEGCALLKGTF